MTTTSRASRPGIPFFFLMAVLAVPGLAQERGATGAGDAPAEALAAGSFSEAPGNVLSVAGIIGSPVIDAASDSVGSVEDVIVGRDGRIEGLLVHAGGSAKGRSVAVPIDVAQLDLAPDGRSVGGVRLKADASLLAHAPRVTAGESTALDEEWLAQMRRLYGVKATRTASEDSAATGEPLRDENGLPVAAAFMAGRVTGSEVRDGMGVEVGRIEDIAIDPDGLSVRYAVLQDGDGALLALPWEAVDPAATGGSVQVAVEQAILQAEDGFDRGHWPQHASDRLRQHMQVRQHAQDNAANAERHHQAARRAHAGADDRPRHPRRPQGD